MLEMTGTKNSLRREEVWFLDWGCAGMRRHGVERFLIGHTSNFQLNYGSIIFADVESVERNFMTVLMPAIRFTGPVEFSLI